MNARGYSLVEVMVVIGILTFLGTIGIVNYREYSQRYRAESQTRMLYQELLKARSDALYQRREVHVRIYPERFEIYSTTSDSGVLPARILRLSFPLRCKGEPDGGGGVALAFDSRGIALANCTICLGTAISSAVDSVVVSRTRVRIGKNEDPNVCEPAKIATQ